MTAVFIAILLGNVISVLCAAVLLLAGEKLQERLMPWLLSFATGTLLCTGFAGMLPKALSQALPQHVMLALLGGILLFFLLEKTLLWRHCHNKNCTLHSAAGHIVILGDSVHNFMDGVAIAAAFSNSPSLGIGTAIAVFAHELPQEVGDFAVLLNSGFSKSRALMWNLLSGLAALLGGLLAWLVMDIMKAVIPYALAFSAASMIYVAMADLIPSLRNPQATGARHFLALLAAIALMLGIIL
ncbi:MAG: ZIP family metal transporter [Elusimicrobiaceae bacterium]|nr:ZIP family metal transporter [Elusimicrobiaceae bacterium]